MSVSFPAWPEEVDKGFVASLPVDQSDVEAVQVLTKKDLVIALRDDEENKARIAKLQKILANARK